MRFLLKSGLLLLIVLFHSELTFSGTEHIYQPSNDVFPNPERGLYGPIQITTPPPVWGFYMTDIRNQGHSLAYTAITLENFRTSMIDSTTLNNISSHFQEMRVAGVKAIVRINYNNDISGVDTSLM